MSAHHHELSTLSRGNHVITFDFLEGTMSLSKLSHLRPGAARAYSTAVGKEVVIVGCARFHTHHSSVCKAFQS